MYANLMFDFVVGLIPLIGDFADAWFKCNTRNNMLLERYLRERGAKNPAPPPMPKQSTVQRLFGAGPSAPGDHPLQPVSHGATDSPAAPAVAPIFATEGAKPDLPPRHGAPVTKGSVLESSDQGLEAQNNNEGMIYYRRED
jgi:hypothetical protein